MENSRAWLYDEAAHRFTDGQRQFESKRSFFP
jgi:hypothetical protein